MKANTPKRKVFHDAVDLLTLDLQTAETPAENSIIQIPVDNIRPFPDHPFRLYEGDRLEEMVQSVKDHGILVPVIVRKIDDIGYEMLAGHNRQQAARLAGLQTIPAIVKEGLTGQEALVYVIETNMLQRSFSELSTSEKAAVLAERYDKVISQGRRNDILRELEEMNGRNAAANVSSADSDSTCGHDDHKLIGGPEDAEHDPQGQEVEHGQYNEQGQHIEQRQDSEQSSGGTGFDTRSREMLGAEHGISGSSVKRLLRVNQLIPALKEQVDAGRFSLETAVQLSYVSEEIQGIVADADCPVSREMALKLRKEGLTAEDAGRILREFGHSKTKSAGRSIRLPADVYEKYFHKVKAAEAAQIIEAALAAWFEKGGQAHVQ